MKKLICTLVKPLAALALFAVASASSAADKIPVLASFSILGDLVRVVGSDRVTVTTLVGADDDAHVFEPKAGDAKNLLQTQLLVTNGLGFEPWAQKLVKSAGYKGQTVVASQGVKPRQMPAEKGHDHAETDPHAWQNPTNVMLYVRNIADALSKLDPDGKSIYQANSEAYAKALQAPVSALLTTIAGWHAQQRTVVAVLHDDAQVREHFPQTVLLARELIDWGPTSRVMTGQRLASARQMAEAWDDDAGLCDIDAVARARMPLQQRLAQGI